MALLLVAATTGYQTRMFADAAARLGIKLILATDRCHVLEDPWGDRALPVRFEDPEQAAKTIAQQEDLNGVVALGERPAYIAALAARRMGLRFSPPEAVAACGDKFLARERFAAAGLSVPRFARVPLNEKPERAAAATSYPCVLKPLGLSASRGVIRANSPAEFVSAFRRIQALLRRPDIAGRRADQNRYLQVEEFIPGREFALEGLVTNGRLRVLALFDKPDPLDGPFFEETIYVTPSRESADTQRAIIETTACAVAALGLTHGPVHAEMRVSGCGVWMLEVAARPIGGLCAQALPGLAELILRHAAGVAPGCLDFNDARGVMMIPIPREGVYVGVSGEDAARNVPGVEDVIITAKQGQTLIPLPEGNSYLGFIFARASTPDQVERALRSAHARLDFETAATLPLIQDFARGG
jgi:hypothetical protein